MTKPKYLVVLCAGLALVASVGLTPAASASSVPITCPNYHGRVLAPKTGADGKLHGHYVSAYYREVKVTGVSCKLADKELRVVHLPGGQPSIVVTVGGVAFTETVMYIPHGFDLYLNAKSPKDAGDAITAVTNSN